MSIYKFVKLRTISTLPELQLSELIRLTVEVASYSCYYASSASKLRWLSCALDTMFFLDAKGPSTLLCVYKAH